MERPLDQQTRKKITDDFFERCKRVLIDKGRDYSPNNDAFESFKIDGIEKEMVLWVFLNKHLKAIQSYIKRGATESEPVEMRILDAINYLAILFAMLMEQHENPKAHTPSHKD